MENDIKRHDGDNLGGINSFRFTPINSVQEIPPVFKGAIHSEIVLKPNTRWYDGYCTEGTMQYNEETLDSEHGDAHKKTFTGKVPKTRQEINDLFDNRDPRGYILEITYNSGLLRIAGTTEEPLFFKEKESSKEEVQNRNEYDILFEGPGLKKSPFYNI